MDTGQPTVAPETALANAADAFKAFDNPPRPRDEYGRFASPEPEQEEETEVEEAAVEEPTADEPTDDDVETEDVEEAAEEAQPDDIPMPASWSKEDAEIWSELSPSAKAKVLTREGQRDAAINLKFQEAANERKQAEAIASEAAANRQRYAEAIDQVLSLAQPVPPNRADYGYGTEYWDRDAYEVAREQYDATKELVGTLQQQREALSAQQKQEEQAQFQRQWAEGAPKLMETIPDLADPNKRPALERDLGNFAIQSGFPAEILAQASPVEVAVLWKAMQYDRQQEAAARVKATAKPAPKPAQPAIRPGVAPTRSNVEQANNQKAMKRLAQTGSVEDAAYFFRQRF